MVATLQDLTDEQARRPSLLPGWTVGHVAHAHRPQCRGSCANVRGGSSWRGGRDVSRRPRAAQPPTSRQGQAVQPPRLAADVTATAAQIEVGLGSDARRGVGRPRPHDRGRVDDGRPARSSVGGRPRCITPTSGSASRGRIGIPEYVRLRTGAAHHAVGQPQADGHDRSATPGRWRSATTTASPGCSVEPRSTALLPRGSCLDATGSKCSRRCAGACRIRSGRAGVRPMPGSRPACRRRTRCWRQDRPTSSSTSTRRSTPSSPTSSSTTRLRTLIPTGSPERITDDTVVQASVPDDRRRRVRGRLARSIRRWPRRRWRVQLSGRRSVGCRCRRVDRQGQRQRHRHLDRRSARHSGAAPGPDRPDRGDRWRRAGCAIRGLRRRTGCCCGWHGSSCWSARSARSASTARRSSRARLPTRSSPRCGARSFGSHTASVCWSASVLVLVLGVMLLTFARRRERHVARCRR